MAPSPWAILVGRHVDLEGEYAEPIAGVIISVILAMLSLVIISSFLTQRFLAVKIWARLPFVQWLVFAIYADSFLFVFATAILQFGFGVDESISVCEAAILLCLVCYVTTKLIYLFLVEKAHIIRPTGKKPRLHSKLYLTNSFGMIGIYCGVVVLNFIYRITRVENGQCIIGMKKLAMIPLIAFDLLVNIYLTILFLIPLSGLYSFKNMRETRGNRRLRTVALRTFIGCVCTLISSIVNLTVLMALEGEPGWVCLMCCNSDILFSAIVIQWVTSRDSNSTVSDSLSISQGHSHAGGGPGDELSHIRSQRSRQRTSRTGAGSGGGGVGGTTNGGSYGTDHTTTNKSAGGDDLTTSVHRGSVDSDCCTPPIKRSAIASTEAIVDDAADMSIVDDSPRSMNGPFSDDKRIWGNGGGGGHGHGHDDEKDVVPLDMLPRLPPPSWTNTARHVPSASEVLVHVDYGASLSRETTGEGVRLGNSIVIGAGTAPIVSGGGGPGVPGGGGAGSPVAVGGVGAGGVGGEERRGRRSPWFLGGESVGL
ncbi:hypothetical protein QBC47DRAFT_402982 [Echria macrotheca]|uniref:Uncharacterized protein n=1 Tax=Echria macrotheca TaxID=438768 RepID=A0AAJ0BA86_9PEZI|nr:hypothetical protein QBC47DRAFT_402982 [Echria macrotheca]